MIDGNAAYCMNFGLAADGGQLMNSYDNPSTSLSAAQEKQLAYCLYFGYGCNSATVPSNDQCDQYIAMARFSGDIKSTSKSICSCEKPYSFAMV